MSTSNEGLTLIHSYAKDILTMTALSIAKRFGAATLATAVLAVPLQAIAADGSQSTPSATTPNSAAVSKQVEDISVTSTQSMQYKAKEGDGFTGDFKLLRLAYVLKDPNAKDLYAPDNLIRSSSDLREGDWVVFRTELLNNTNKALLVNPVKYVWSPNKQGAIVGPFAPVRTGVTAGSHVVIHTEPIHLVGSNLEPWGSSKGTPQVGNDYEYVVSFPDCADCKDYRFTLNEADYAGYERWSVDTTPRSDYPAGAIMRLDNGSEGLLPNVKPETPKTDIPADTPAEVVPPKTNEVSPTLDDTPIVVPPTSSGNLPKDDDGVVLINGKAIDKSQSATSIKDTKPGTHPKAALAKTGVTQGTVTMLFGALGAALVGGGILFLRRKNGR